MEKVSLAISREEKLSKTVRSFLVLYDKSHKGFKEKYTMKNAQDGVPTALEFLLTLLFHFLRKKNSHLIHLN